MADLDALKQKYTPVITMIERFVPYGATLDAVDLAAQRERDVLLPDVAVEISDHVLLGRPTAGAERNPLSGKVGQITIGVQPEVVVAVAPRHRWCGGFIDDQRRNPVAVLELACDGKTARPGSDDDDAVLADHGVEATKETTTSASSSPQSSWRKCPPPTIVVCG